MDIPMFHWTFGQERCRARTGTTGATGASLSVPSKETSEAAEAERSAVGNKKHSDVIINVLFPLVG